MSSTPVHTPIALKLHAFGLTQLHDPNWTGSELFDRLKQHTRGRAQPIDLLRKTLQQGLLFQIGRWLLEDYFISDTHRFSLGGEYRLWYLEDLLQLLESAGVSGQAPLIIEASATTSQINALYERDEAKYFEAVDENALYDLIGTLIVTYETEIHALFDGYAENYSDRVFHDRQLCEHLSRTLVAVGFDGTSDGSSPPQQWIDRQSNWPSWAVKAVVARDQGECADCGINITFKLEATQHIDHIVPLANGGTNDLSNLQLLCEPCNLRKGAQSLDVRSSIPHYLQLTKKKRP